MEVQGSSDLILENQFYYKVAVGEIEIQPDVYYFNFPGYSGSFVILKNKSIVMRDYSELVINPVFDANDDITGFTVIDPMGKMYQFGDPERSEFQVGEEMIEPPAPSQHPTYTYNSSWYLTSINSADASEKMTFINEKVSTLNGEAYYLAPINSFHNDIPRV